MVLITFYKKKRCLLCYSIQAAVSLNLHRALYIQQNKYIYICIELFTVLVYLQNMCNSKTVPTKDYMSYIEQLIAFFTNTVLPHNRTLNYKSVTMFTFF